MKENYIRFMPKMVKFVRLIQYDFQLQLTGVATATGDFEITDVSTAALFTDFTRKALASPISVVDGQDVELTVEISFS